jgi:hypothetical protein
MKTLINKILLKTIFLSFFVVFLMACETKSKKETEDHQKIGTKVDENTFPSNAHENEILDQWLKEFIGEKEVIEHLGNPEKRGHIEYWDAVATYVQSWEYPSKGIFLEMESESKNALKTVKSISISRPCTFQTSQGIGIGSDIGLVRDAYQKFIDTEFSDDTILVIGSVYGGTIFEMEENKVVKIFIGAAAE